jgi:PadR family transcriptional regulator
MEIIMNSRIERKLFLGFIQIHILHHAKKEAIYGSWMMKELDHHGYRIGPGSMYPILKSMETDNLLTKYEETVEGKVRKYYKTTALGEEVLDKSREKASELFKEIEEK